jgi:uncharacterized protein (DUF1697 family)
VPKALDTYVAFLRGINVGGNNIIKMDALRAEFEKMGFHAVRTYIQSGNVIFRTDLLDRVELEKKIETSLSAAFDYKARVLVRSKVDLESSILHFPDIFENPEWKHNVIFLSDAIDSEDIVTRFETKKDIEQLHYHKGVLYWSALMKEVTRTTMSKVSTRKEYREMTVRNVNTTKKILELMNRES